MHAIKIDTRYVALRGFWQLCFLIRSSIQPQVILGISPQPAPEDPDGHLTTVQDHPRSRSNSKGQNPCYFQLLRGHAAAIGTEKRA